MQLLAAAAGVIGPIAFLSVLILAGALRADYDPVSRYVSDLAVGENGWLQTANFIVFGSLVIVFASGLPRALGGDRAVRASTALLTLSGTGLILAGFFPTDLAHEVPTAHGAGHFVASLLTFGALILAVFLVALALRLDARWPGYATYSLVTGVLATGLCLAASAAIPGVALNNQQAGPLASWTGLVQRALFLVAFAWIAITGLRLMSLVRTPYLTVQRGARWHRRGSAIRRAPPRRPQAA